MFRRISAFLLCIVMLAGMLPISAFAQEPEVPESTEIAAQPQETTAPAEPTEGVPPVTEIAQSEPVPTDAAQTEPVVVETVPAEPAATEPALTEPVSTEPVPTEAVIADEAVNTVSEGIGGTCGTNLTWTYAGGTLTISGSGKMSNYSSDTIPWIDHIESITNIVMESGVASIGSYAFQNCINLTSVTIPESVTSIGGFAFEGCIALAEINLPASVTSIGIASFENCTSLAEIAIPAGVTSIGMGAFQNCSSLTEISIPAGVTAINDSTFWGCTNLAEITLPQSLTSIGYYAFMDCSSLKSITIPEGVPSIKYQAFWKCSNLESVTLPETVTSIESAAFYNCSSLTDISMPESLTQIGNQVFSGCSSLTELTIPQGVTSIGSHTFSDCTALQSVVLPASLTSIGTYCFSGCSSLKSISIPEGVTSIPDSAFSKCTSLSSITLPESVTTIGSATFWNCSSLSSITIPDGVTSIGSQAFQSCTGLSEIYIPESVTTITADSYSYSPFFYCSPDLVIYCGADAAPAGWGPYWNYCNSSTALTTHYGVNQLDLTFWDSLDTSAESILIPSGVTYIPNRAFQDFTNLKSVYIPASVTELQIEGIYYESPFYGCSSSVVIYCEASSAPASWGSYWNNYSSGSKLAVKYSWNAVDYSFWNNLDTSAESIIIPDGVTFIPAQAFSDCSNLKYVYIPESVTTIAGDSYDDSPFYDCSDALLICCGASSKPSGWFSYWNYYTRNYYYNTNVNVFYGSTAADVRFWANLDTTTESIVIPDGITLIPESAFANCTNLKSVYIPDSVRAICSYAFQNCTALEYLYIPASVTKIDNAAFKGCNDGLPVYCETVTSSSGWGSNWNYTYNSGYVSALYNYTRQDCDFWRTLDETAETIIIPDGITIIPELAFQNCTNLKYVYIPESVVSIPGSGNSSYYDTPFFGCDSNIVVYCEADTEPSGWREYWYAYYYDGRGIGLLRVHYGHTLTDFNYWTKIDKTQSSITIPDGITQISDHAFSGCTGLAEITIPSSVTKIGSYAFGGCTGLTEVTIPDGVTKIGSYAFSGCTGLTEITIPDSITEIGEGAFRDCTSLTEITIPKSVSFINTNAFYDCSGLTDVYFEHTSADELTMGSLPFYIYNDGYTEIQPINFHVPTIRDIHPAIQALDGTDRIVTWDYTGNIPATAITLTEANSTTEIEAGLDLNFTAALTPADTTSELVWTATNGGIVEASDYVSGTATIIGVNPGTMTVRCESADDPAVFAQYQVEILEPTADVASITVRSDTPYANEVEVGTKAQMIADIHPGNAANKEVVWELENGTGTAQLDENGMLTALTTGTVTVYATATDGTEVIGSATINIVRYVDDLSLLFNGDPTRTTIGVGEPVRVTLEHFPVDATDKSVTWTLTDRTGSIIRSHSSSGNSSSGGAYILIQGETAGTATLTATANDSQKTSVTVELEVVGEKASHAVEGGNIYYNTVTGAIVDADDTVTVANIPARINGTTITSIAPDAFSNHSAWSYYNDNTTLTSVTIPSTVTYIGDHAFDHCINLTSLRLGSNVTTIGERAFYYCNSLANLTIPDSVTSVGYNAFFDMSSLKYLTMPGDLNLGNGLHIWHTLDSVTFTGETIISQPATEAYGYIEVTTLPGRNAKQVIINDSVTSIEDYAFYGIYDIESVTIGNGVTTIGEQAFAGCGSLANVTMGENVAEINTAAFRSCALATINLPDGLTHIGDKAFSWCTALTAINLPDGLTHIGDQAFCDCDALTTINLPESLTHIGEGAFWDCYNLQLLDLSGIPDTITQQNFPLTADLAGIPDVLVRATGGKTELWWNAREIEGETGEAGIHQDSNNKSNLYIYESGKVKLQCTDEYTGAQGYKIINCELGLEIEGLWENYLTAGQKVTLTAYRADTNAEESVTWSLRLEDKAYASLSRTSGTSTVLTAKSVEKATQIQITATSNVAGEAPETRTIWILPAVSGITIADEDGNIVGKTGTSVQTIQVDLRETKAMQLFTATYPEGASTDVSWGSSNFAIADPYPAEGYIGNYDFNNPIVTLNSTGTVTLTAYATDGSGKNASVKLKIYYLDTAKKLTAKTTVPAVGLEDGASAQIQIFGSDKNNPLDPAAFTYTVADGQEEMAFIDENGIITAGSKAGTVTITAAIKDDPMGRKVTLKVKIIPAQTESIQLIPAADEPAEIIWLDANGEITETFAEAVRFRVYLDKDHVKAAKLPFIVAPIATDTNGNPSKSSLKWATTDKRVATVAANADGTATVTIPAKADGACVITATSTDLAKVEGVLEIFVRDYAPRLESASLTVNSNLLTGVSTGLTPSYGNGIVSVELTDAAAPFTVAYADDLLTVTPNDVLKNGTYKLTVKVTCEEYGPYEIPLTVKVANKLPTVTVKQSGKFNLFYTYSSTNFQISVKNESILYAEIDPSSTASFYSPAYDESVLTVKFTKAYIDGTAGKLDSKVNVLVHLEGYRVPVSKSVSIATKATKPSVSLTPASSVINTATQGEHSTTIRAYNKATGEYLQILPKDVTATFADISSSGDGVKLTLTEIEGKVNKGGSAKILVKDANWMQPITLTHKVTVQTKLPTVNVSASTITLNRIFTKQAASMTVTLNQQNIPIGSIKIEAADKTEKLLAESAKILVEPSEDGSTFTFRLNKENLPTNGKYSFRAIVTLEDGTELAAKTFKVNVSSTAPTVKLKTSTLKLNKKLGTQYAAAWSEFTLSKGDGYEIAGFQLPEGWSNSDISVEYRDGMVYAKLLRTEDTAKKHTVNLTPILRHIATGEESAFPTTVKLTVQIESKTPGVTVTSKGKLDATLPGNAITHTIKSFTNVYGTPTDVKLAGTHGELFKADLDPSGSIVTLKMRDDIKYNLKTTYKVDLVFIISGQEVSKSVSFKISQSKLKFATVKALNLYQFQSQPVTTTIMVTAPAGAAIEDITLNGKTALQFRRALGNGNMTVTPIGDGSRALVSFTFAHPGHLTYGKSYTVLLDVTPVSTAETIKTTQVKLTVKSFK